MKIETTLVRASHTPAIEYDIEFGGINVRDLSDLVAAQHGRVSQFNRAQQDETILGSDTCP